MYRICNFFAYLLTDWKLNSYNLGKQKRLSIVYSSNDKKEIFRPNNVNPKWYEEKYFL
jgi:hypothetical protein